MRPSHLAALVALAALACPAHAQDQQPEKQNLPTTEYEKWERLGQVAISNDGHWVVAGVSLVDGDPRLEIRNSDGPERWTVPNATRAQFSEDSKWVLFTITVPREEAEKMRKAKKRVENKLGLHSLQNGSLVVFESVSSWQLVEDTSKVLIHRYPAEDAGGAGGDFEVFDLADGTTMPFGNVRSAVAHSELPLVAIHTVSAADNEGVQVLDLRSMKSYSVAWAKNHFRNISWAEDADVLAYLIGKADEKKEGDWNVVATAGGFMGGSVSQTVFEPKDKEGFPEGSRISEAAGLRFSDDGTSLVFGVAEWRDKDKPATEDVAGVQIWHTKDVTVMPLQERTAGQERNRASRWVLSPAIGAFKKFAEPELDGLRVSPDHKWAVANDPRPYAHAIKSNGLEYVDVVVIDIANGTRRKMMEKAVSNAGGVDASAVSLSPKGTYAVYFDGKDWICDRLADGNKVNLTKKFGVRFDDREDDHTVPKPPAAGFPVWQEDDVRVFLHNDYDVFFLNPETGDGMPITDGEDTKTRYRVIDTGLHDDGIHSHDPITFAVFETRTKRSGFARWTHEEGFKTLALDDARLSWGARSKDTDRVMFIHQTFQQSPSAFLTNDAFSAAKPLVRTNLRQSEFNWGRAELVNYRALGQDLQGVLIYPAGYEAGKSYPMVTYIYERLSDGLHQYMVPNNTSPYNQQHFSQAGYFVFMPDIVYEDRQPGESAVTCIEAGLNAVLRKNVGVDRTKVGLTGHSWGGYETVFTATHSKMFAAYVAGAPLTELISMYSSFYWNWGQTNQVIFEVSQGRMEVPFWEDMRAYIDNSPLFHAGDISAPMMVEVGTVDGAVDWHQGQYLYNTLRRMGKNMVMLVYANENHGLAVPANQKDYAMRARHFFDVYLKGATPQKWVNEGVPFIRLGEELKPPKKEVGG